MQSFSFIPFTASEEKIFEYFFENLPYMLPWQPIKFSDLDKMNRRGLLKKHFCKPFVTISAMRQQSMPIFIFFFHYKSMATINCHSNQSSYPIGTKTILFAPPDYRCFMWNTARIGFMVSEEMGDVVWICWRRRRTDACLYYKLTYEPSALVS